MSSITLGENMLFLVVIFLTNVSVASVIISFRGSSFIHIRLCNKLECVVLSKHGQRILITYPFNYVGKQTNKGNLSPALSLQLLLFLPLHTFLPSLS